MNSAFASLHLKCVSPPTLAHKYTHTQTVYLSLFIVIKFSVILKSKWQTNKKKREASLWTMTDMRICVGPFVYCHKWHLLLWMKWNFGHDLITIYAAQRTVFFFNSNSNMILSIFFIEFVNKSHKALHVCGNAMCAINNTDIWYSVVIWCLWKIIEMCWNLSTECFLENGQQRLFKLTMRLAI